MKLILKNIYRSSASAHSSPILPNKMSLGKKSSMKDREDEILVVEEMVIRSDAIDSKPRIADQKAAEKSRKAKTSSEKPRNKLIEIIPSEKPRHRMELEVNESQDEKIVPQIVEKNSQKQKLVLKESMSSKEPR